MIVFTSLQKLQCSPTSDGAAAAVLASEKFVKDYGLHDKGNHTYNNYADRYNTVGRVLIASIY